MLKETILTPDKFFIAGGTMELDTASYVKRPADDNLLHQVLAGQFCYVLTPRQMGKSSLMVRTIQRLEGTGVKTVKIDLQEIGQEGINNLDQLCQNLLDIIAEGLTLSVTPETWWQTRPSLSPVRRFITYLRDVVLSEIENQVVIFIDEIDVTLNYDFRDDFFAAIRSMYNARATDLTFKRLTFVLLGVVAPADLIKNPRLSPFNIGQQIDLQEFNPGDASVLRDGLEKFHPGQGQTIFGHIYEWTAGHPFLTQTLSMAASKKEDEIWGKVQVDELVEQSLSGESIESKKLKKHLGDIQKNILGDAQRRQLLKLYKRIYQGEAVKDDTQSLSYTHLKLSGLVTTKDEQLQLRNDIYRQVFNLAWIKENLPIYLEYLEGIIATTVAVLLLLSGFFVWRATQQQQPAEVLAQAYENDFRNNTDSSIRLNSLANLFGLPEYGDKARALFFDNTLLPLDKRIELFNNAAPNLQSQVRTVVRGTYAYLNDTKDDNRVLQAMQTALKQSDEAESKILAIEISHWLDGRAALAAKNYEEAKRAYTEAIETNDQNPATHFERGLVLAALQDYQSALADFENAILVKGWSAGPVRQAIMSNKQLYDVLWDNQDKYPALVLFLPTPTSSPTSTDTPTSPPSTATPTPEPTWTPTNTPILPTSTPAPTGTPMLPEAVVIAPNGLNLRSGPGSNYSIIGFLRNGDTLDVQGRITSNEWIQVLSLSFDTLGWVAAGSGYVTINVDLNTLPTVQPPPTPTPIPTTPILLTELSIFNDTKGDITFIILGTGVSCTIPKNTTQFCGSFRPGAYQVKAISICGTATIAKIYNIGSQTTRIFCN